jgi:hypothetical protein
MQSILRSAGGAEHLRSRRRCHNSSRLRREPLTFQGFSRHDRGGWGRERRLGSPAAGARRACPHLSEKGGVDTAPNFPKPRAHRTFQPNRPCPAEKKRTRPPPCPTARRGAGSAHRPSPGESSPFFGPARILFFHWARSPSGGPTGAPVKRIHCGARRHGRRPAPCPPSAFPARLFRHRMVTIPVMSGSRSSDEQPSHAPEKRPPPHPPGRDRGGR